MSEQELEAKMKQILDDYAQIIDVTPTSESSLPKPENHRPIPKSNTIIIFIVAGK